MRPDLELNEDDVNPTPVPARRRWQMSLSGLMKLVVALACVFGVISVLSRREQPREMRPAGSLCQQSQADCARTPQLPRAIWHASSRLRRRRERAAHA